MIGKKITGVSLGSPQSQARMGFHFKVKEMLADERSIGILAARNGKLYEVHKHPAFTASKETNHEPLLDEWGEGFCFHLPRVPERITRAVWAFFVEQLPNEGLLFLYWNAEQKEYYLVQPEQETTPTEVNYVFPIQWKEDDVLVAHIHSHASDKAYFSPTDNEDEVATGIYVVFGQVDKPQVQIVARCSVNSYFLPFNPNLIFEGVWL